ncbi:MAG: mechanosensitive ion channel family protein [Actinobacteria bacterium]|nr:mechanosensitive ion channel family protein [Cyanobacteriota bacterium]MCL5772052.1 mechanosensitive ion channel family protein [Actinomycetota bacterium]
MNENLKNFGINSQNIVINFKTNWIPVTIVFLSLLILLLVIRIILRKVKKVIDDKIPDNKTEIKKKSFTFTNVAGNLIIVFITLAAILIISQQLGINLIPVLTGAGILGIVIGFGAQNLIKDIINGMFILFEQWFQINDIIAVGDKAGVVEKFNLRVTVIRDLNGKVHYIPNGQINILSNLSQEWANAVVDIGVHYKENTDKVIKVLEEIFDDLVNDVKYKDLILERPEILGDNGVDDLSNSSVIFKIICKVKPSNQWTIERQLRKKIKDKFDEAGIEIPYPSRNIYIKDNNDTI